MFNKKQQNNATIEIGKLYMITCKEFSAWNKEEMEKNGSARVMEIPHGELILITNVHYIDKNEASSITFFWGDKGLWRAGLGTKKTIRKLVL